MISEILFMNGYGLYVWSSFAFTLLSFFSLFVVTKIQYARERAEMYHSNAHACLDRLPENPALIALRELTDYQLKRIS